MGEPTFIFTSLCWAQGAYFLLTGAWPLLSMRTFQAVTGRKTDNWTGRVGDHWLVKTVGVLVVAISLPLLVSAVRGQPTLEALVLACGSSLGLMAIDVIYVARRVIAPIYLLDALAQLLLLAGWGLYSWLLLSA